MMKTNQILLSIAAVSVSFADIRGQSLSEKKYDLTQTAGQIFSSTSYVPFGTAGYVMATSTSQSAPSNPKTIIVRVDEAGGYIWGREYDPAGNQAFDENSLIRTHRVGYNPEESAYGEEREIIVVGEVTDGGGNLAPGYIVLDPTNGDVVNEVYFDDGAPGIGHMSAIHTVADGNHQGAYMAGSMIYGSPPKYCPILIKIGGTSNFARLYDVTKFGESTFYHDVDVEEGGEGLIMVVGHNVGFYGDANFGDPILDVIDQSGGVTAQYAYYTGSNARFSAIKSIGGGRALIGGSLYGYQGFLLEVDLTNGNINWIRNVQPGALITQGGIEVSSIGDVVEVELDKEAMPIFLGVTSGHELGNNDPGGPGLFARTETNGVEDWAVSEEMTGGYGDLEPQHSIDGLLSAVTGISESGYTSHFILAEGNSQGFSGCQSKIGLSMEVNDDEWELYDPDEYQLEDLNSNDETPADQNFDELPDDGCCWLPAFNPLPWSHPWESTYWDIGSSGADLDAGSGFSNYTWNLIATRDVYNGDVVASNVPGTGQVFNVPFQGTYSNIYSGSKSSEFSTVEVTVTDDDGCYGWDATYVHLAEDGFHNIPDYSTSYNIHENEDYFYCQTSLTSPSRHLYEPHGIYLTSNGFSTLTGPHNILNLSSPNHLLTTSTKDFYLSLDDSYNDGGTPRNNTIHTDVYVEGNCNCPPSAGSIEIIEDDGRVYYSYSKRDQNIVKYSYSLHMVDPSIPYLPDNLKLIKRIYMRNGAASSSIDPDDYLLPVVDDRYFDDYPSFTGPQILYLDMWFTNDTTYPFTICDHERVEISNAVVTRKKKPNGNNVQNAQARPGNEAGKARELDSYAIYPNPSNGRFEVSGIAVGTRIFVFDLEGRELLTISNSESNSNAVIDLSSCQSGMYILHLHFTDGTRSVEKLVKN